MLKVGLCIFVGSSCAVYLERCKILTVVYKIIKTSKPLYKGELMSWKFCTLQKNPALSNKRHMTNQQIYFSGLTRFVHTCLGLILKYFYNSFSFRLFAGSAAYKKGDIKKIFRVQWFFILFWILVIYDKIGIYCR